MSIKGEIRSDLDLRIPRIMIHGNRGMIDNVKSIDVLSEESITVSCGKYSISIVGTGLSITYLEGEHLLFEGVINTVEFYGKKVLHE